MMMIPGMAFKPQSARGLRRYERFAADVRAEPVAYWGAAN
jgi:hypothetical protein